MRRPACLCYAFGWTVAPLYERRLLPEEQPAVIDRRYSGPEAVYKEIVESGPRKLADLFKGLRGRRSYDAPCWS